jgi:hypothetical protein
MPAPARTADISSSLTVPHTSADEETGPLPPPPNKLGLIAKMATPAIAASMKMVMTAA